MKQKTTGTITALIAFLRQWAKTFYAKSEQNSDFKFLGNVFFPQLVRQLEAGIPLDSMEFELKEELAEKTADKNAKKENVLNMGQLLLLTKFSTEWRSISENYEWAVEQQKLLELVKRIFLEGNDNPEGYAYATFANVKTKPVVLQPHEANNGPTEEEQEGVAMCG